MSTGRRVAIRRRSRVDQFSSDVQSLEPRRLFAGGPDPSFGINGIARLDYVASSDNVAVDTAFAPDGKLLVSSDTYNASADTGLIIRYLADGRLDTTFGTGGIARAGAYGSGGILRVLPQSDGSMLLLPSDKTRPRVLKMDASGQLVPNWGVTDARLISSNRDLADLGGGRSLLVTGQNVAELNPNGTLDTTFGTGATGIINMPAPSGQVFNAYSAAVDSSGRVVVVGELLTVQTAVRSEEVRRFLPNGQPDTSFDGDGVRPLNIAPSGSEQAYLTIQSDGKILAVVSDPGNSTIPTNAAVTRLNADGSADNGFGSAGSKSFAFTVGRPHVLTNGKIFFAGFQNNSTYSLRTPLALQLTAAGQPDTSFDGDGIRDGLSQSTWLPMGASAGAVRADGRFVLGATIYPGAANTGATEDVVLYGLNANGSTDTTFGTSSGTAGRVITDVPESMDQNGPGASIIDAQGRILQPGWSSITEGTDMLVGRLTPTGAPDTTFGSGGIARLDGGARNDLNWAIAAQTDGKIVAVGRANYLDWQAGFYDDNFLVARFLANGQPDTTFGTGGKTTFDFGGSFPQFLHVAIQADGKILATGISDNFRPVVVRLLSTGAIDTTFGNAGIEAFDPPGTNDTVSAITILPGGNILVGGSTDMPTGTAGKTDGARYLLRLKSSDGAPDTAYGTGGFTILQEPETSEGVIGLVPDGTGGFYLAGGASSSSSSGRFLLTKLTSTGTVDTTFGTAGTSSVTQASGYGFSSVERAGGGFVAAGTFKDSHGNSDFALLRMRADGTADPNFGTGGFMSYDLGATSEGANAVHSVTGGGVVVTGTSSTPTTARDWVAFRVLFGMPKVTGGSFQADATGTKVRVTFNADVSNSLSVLDFRLANQATPSNGLLANTVTYDTATNTATFTFTATSGGPLPDGDYAATLTANGVWDASGNHVDGDGNGAPGGDWNFQFSQLTGLTAAAGSSYTLTGPATAKVLNVTAGTVTLTRDLSAGYPGVSLNVSGGATVYFAVDQHFANVSLSGNGSISVGQPPAGSGVVAGTPDPNAGGGAVSSPTPTPTPAPGPATHPLVLTAENAAFVRDGTYANTAFPSDPSLVVKHGPTGFSRETYLTFDLSHVSGAVHSAKLRLFGKLNQSAHKGVPVRVFAATRPVAHGRLTWNTRPVAGVSPQTSATVSGTSGRWYEWDLTSLLRAQRAAGRNVVTLVLKGTTATDAAALFDAGRTGAKGPQLVVA